MNKKALWIGIPIVLLGVVGAAFALRSKGERLLIVQTSEVTREKIVQTVNATGRIQPRTQVKISGDVSAKITRLAVEEGQWVEEGAFLVELDRERYLAAVESAEASVRAALANANLVRENLSRLEKEYNRSRELMSRDVETQAAFDAAESAYLVEKARLESAVDQAEQAKAALKQAMDDLSKTTIYAPMSGTISDLNKEQGEIAIGSQFQEDVILVIADLSEMEALVNVDENDIVSVEIGQIAEIEVDALRDRKLAGVVAEIANSANATTQGSTQKTEFEVTIRVTDQVESLRPGMTASADIFTRSNDAAVSVPIQSVAVRTLDQLQLPGETREDAESRYTVDEDGFVEVVFRIDDGRAVATQVETGIQSDELIEILSGLSEGDEVVTGSYRAISRDLENGAPVTIDNDDDSAVS